MSVSNKAKQQMLRMETFAKFPYLIEITIPNGDVYRYANCDDDLTFENHTFSAGYFTITPPDKQEQTVGNGKLTISAVDQLFIQLIRENSERAVIRFVAAIIYNDDNDVETLETIDDTEYQLTVADWDDVSITWTMLFDDGMNILEPCDVCTSQKCPAIQ